MTFRLGLTGSIGTGKSTTATLFTEFGCDVWDADQAVHLLYEKGGAAVYPISKVFPSSIVNDAVCRTSLKEILSQDQHAFSQLEAIVHPLVAKNRAKFVENSKANILVFDIPLLFETNGDRHMDAVACVYIDEETQKKRTLDRGSMTEEQFSQILAKQMPISQKCAKADYIIITDTVEHAREQVKHILEQIRGQIAHARNRS